MAPHSEPPQTDDTGSGPPETRRVPVEVHEGPHRFNDPYRWLEDDSPEVRAWVEAQLRWTERELVSRPERKVLLRRYRSSLSRPRSGRVLQAGGCFFHRIREAGAESWSLRVSTSLDGPQRSLIDTDVLFGPPAPRLADCHPSPDGRFVAFRTASRGRSLMPLHVIDVSSGSLLAERVPADMNPVAHLWHSENRIAWTRDAEGFFYSRAPEGSSAEEVRYRQRIYFHRRGEPVEDDEEVFGEDLADGQMPIPHLSPGGRYLLVVVHDFTGEEVLSAAWIRDAEHEEPGFQVLLPLQSGTLGPFLTDRWAYFKTTRADAGGGIIRMALDDVARQPRVIVDAPLDRGERWSVVGERVVVEGLGEGGSELQVFDEAGRAPRYVPLENGTSLQWLAAASEGAAVLVGISNPRTPPRALRVELTCGSRTELHPPPPSASPSELEVKRVWFHSRDGTRVPMHIVHGRNFTRDGRGPAVVRGYGGFSVSLKPSFRSDILPFLEQGGVYAEACVRGGGELGEAWHRSGMREQKQNSFDDFNSAGEWLVSQGYASEDRLGCIGWSNGGLLTMAASLQRPDLWRAVVAGAPVTDMARFHLCHNGRHWISEYGSPERADELEWLLRYSPYHNMPEHVAAPAVLIYAPDADDRVAPWHGRKMLAQWQRATSSGHPVLLRAGPDLGHGGGTSATRMAERFADIWAFLFWQLGVELGDEPGT